MMRVQTQQGFSKIVTVSRVCCTSVQDGTLIYHIVITLHAYFADLTWRARNYLLQHLLHEE